MLNLMHHHAHHQLLATLNSFLIRFSLMAEAWRVVKSSKVFQIITESSMSWKTRSSKWVLRHIPTGWSFIDGELTSVAISAKFQRFNKSFKSFQGHSSFSVSAFVSTSGSSRRTWTWAIRSSARPAARHGSQWTNGKLATLHPLASSSWLSAFPSLVSVSIISFPISLSLHQRTIRQTLAEFNGWWADGRFTQHRPIIYHFLHNFFSMFFTCKKSHELFIFSSCFFSVWTETAQLNFLPFAKKIFSPF